MPVTERKKPPDRGGGAGGGMENDKHSRTIANNGSGYRKTANVAIQTDSSGPIQNMRPKRQKCGCITIITLSVIVALVAMIAGRLASKIMMDRLMMAEMQLSVGEEGLSIFKAYDRDGDGFLNVIEFEPLLERLNIEDTGERGDFQYGDEDLDPSVEVLTVEAEFIPLKQETMSKSKDKSFLTSRSSLVALDNWTSPNMKVTAFPATTFASFLPDDALQAGQPYTIVKSTLNMFTNQLSSNRYYPPRVTGKEVTIHRLLNVFHPRPFIHSRFGPQGTVAVIRAYSAEYVDIVFRIHAEFQLNEPPNHPFWYTPAQFTGNLIISKDASHIEHFNMYVPANKSLNVDMEWMNGPNEVEHMEVDIGYMPKMELTASNPSSQVTIYSESGDVIYQPDDQPVSVPERRKINWDVEISMEEALRKLEMEMYPFKKIEYKPLDQAFKAARTENKLVHHILLWGALDDQSC